MNHVEAPPVVRPPVVPSRKPRRRWFWPIVGGCLLLVVAIVLLLWATGAGDYLDPDKRAVLAYLEENTPNEATISFWEGPKVYDQGSHKWNLSHRARNGYFHLSPDGPFMEQKSFGGSTYSGDKMLWEPRVIRVKFKGTTARMAFVLIDGEADLALWVDDELWEVMPN